MDCEHKDLVIVFKKDGHAYYKCTKCGKIGNRIINPMRFTFDERKNPFYVNKPSFEDEQNG